MIESASFDLHVRAYYYVLVSDDTASLTGTLNLALPEIGVTVMQKNLPHQNIDLLPSEVADELILYSGTMEVLHVLNPTARFVWDLCDAQHSPADIAKCMHSRFSIPQDHDVWADVMETLRVFSERV